MRPLRIEVEGFSAYRELVTVDFEAVDFFSLAGPTGSGKSSLIDAMIFALYGRVPRLGARAVAPAISAGADRARVRLDFEVDGSEYTAVRLAMRTPTGGATVREARLEKGGLALAEGADDVTTSVEELLRLRFDDFTRTVVLPQGEFARFLVATKSERQGLLRNLLGLDMYPSMRELARTRSAVATERAEGARRALEALDVPDEATMAAASQRQDALEALAATIGDRERELAELDKAVEALQVDQKRVTDAVDRLRSVQVPEGLGQHESRVLEARSSLVDAEAAAEVARETLQGAEERLDALPGPDEVRRWRRAREQLAAIDERLQGSDLATAESAAGAANAALEQGEAALAAARTATSEARMEHSAHELAGRLEPGEPCPVCAREVTDPPRLSPLPVMADLEMAEAARSAEVEAARRLAGEAGAHLAATKSAMAELNDRRVMVEADLEGAPDHDGLDTIAGLLHSTELEVEQAKNELARRERGHKEAADRLADLAEASRRISKHLMSARDSVAFLDPPVPESDDPAVQWKELDAWRDDALQEQIAAGETVLGEIEIARKAADDRRQELIESLHAVGLEGEEPFAVGVATALQIARNTVESHEKAKSDAISLSETVTDATSQAEVALALANHLKANGFEQWLMSGALSELVDGANDLLAQLSGGGYALHSDESGGFSVIDHRNADEMRSVSTLSGGETFLVSLALALSLAETLAAKGGAGLDAIILDEGFGTLDDESLDTAATVLEELTSRGLMVGVITHVKELAARAPVRYEVTREPAGAQVRLVS